MPSLDGRPSRKGTRVAAACVIAVATGAWSRPAWSDPPAPDGPSATAVAADAPRATTLAEAVRDLVDAVRRAGGTAGIAVVDVGSGESLASQGADAPLNPASNAKLATAAAALTRLGPGHRWLTGLYGSRAGDAMGELVLRGQGDPTLRARDLGALAHELSAAGVRRVGSIAVDQSHFDDRFVPPAFDQQPDEQSSFRAPVAAVSLEGNSVLVTIRPGDRGKPARVDVSPTGFVDVVGVVRTTAKKDAEKLTVTVEPKGDRLLARVDGHVPEGGRVAVVARRVEDPRLYAGFVLREALREAGVEVTGGVRAGGEGERHLVAAHRSAPLGEVLGALGKDSDNFVAEMMLKALGATTKGRPATAEAGADAVAEVLRELGAFGPGTRVRNGSGLFDANRISARGLAALLRAAHRDAAIGPEYVAHLSIGGVDGTLRGRFRGWSKTRAIRAKSGTLKAVVALSGYVLAPAGRAPAAFALLVNGVPDKVTTIRPLLDGVVDALARQLWTGDARAPALPAAVPSARR